MKALVTGGAGFLGSHLSEKLLEMGHEVTVIDLVDNKGKWKIQHLLENPKFRFFRGSVLDKDLMDKLVWECDTVFHFAAIVGVDHYVSNPANVLSVNIDGTKLAFDLALKYGKKIVYASTSEIYGKNDTIPFREDSDRILGPTEIDRWSYSTSKAVGEHYAFAYKNMGLRMVILRFFNIYGPRLDSIESGRVLSIFMGQLLRDKPLTVVKDGQQTRCFTYVDDAVEGIIAAATRQEAEGEVFNIGTDKETKEHDMARLMIEIYGSDSKVEFISSEGKYGTSYEDIPRRVPDVSKAREKLGFESTTTLEEGLRYTIQWYKEYYCRHTTQEAGSELS
jgi:UDP-glucose 4-epimerase